MLSLKSLFARLLVAILFNFTLPLYAEGVRIALEVPRLNVNPYHKPYVAIWLETTEREAITTVALWVGKDTWFKDLRQWWRKIGRLDGEKLDGVTGATRSPGAYIIEWFAVDRNGRALPHGDYLLNFEASREEGGRSYIRKKIHIGKNASFRVKGSNELGDLIITTENIR